MATLQRRNSPNIEGGQVMAAFWHKKRDLDIPVTHLDIKLDEANERLNQAKNRLLETEQLMKDFIIEFRKKHRGP